MAVSVPAPCGLFPAHANLAHTPRMPLPPTLAARTRKTSGSRRLEFSAPYPPPGHSLRPLAPLAPLWPTSPRSRPLAAHPPLPQSISDWDLDASDDAEALAEAERAARRRTISLPTHGRKANPALAPAVPAAKWRPWGTIDAAAFPHILDGVIAAADHRCLLALRGVNRAWRARVDAMLFEHVALITPAASPRQVDRGVHARVRAALRKRGMTDAVLLAPRMPVRFLPCLPGHVPANSACIRVLDTYDCSGAEGLFDALRDGPGDDKPELYANPFQPRGLAVARSNTLLAGSFPTPAPALHAPTTIHYLPPVGLRRVTIAVDVGTSRVILRFVPTFVSPFATECDTWLLETTGACDVFFVFDPRAFAAAPNVADLKYNLAAGLAESFELLDTVGVPFPNITLVGLDELNRRQTEGEGDVAFVQNFLGERIGWDAEARVGGMTMAEWEARAGAEAALERGTLPFAAPPFDEE